MPRACRVRPDVPALDRVFDYEVPDALADSVRVGAIVRVELHGRRVRGWVVATDVVPEAEALRPLLSVSSAGPPAGVVDLCRWIAWRWAGPLPLVLRAASPPNVVDATIPFGPVRAGRDHTVELVVWPPAADRRELVTARLAAEGSTIVVLPDAARAATYARELARAGRIVAAFGSERPDAARTAAWATAARGGCTVVGGRRAVLAPVPDLAAVVVLDEGDEALKEQRIPAWSARDVAAERARRAQVPLTLVTPAPTIDAAVLAPGHPVRATDRAGWTRLEVVDPRDEQPGRQLLTDRLTAVVRAELGEQHRVVGVLNRKGRARLLFCDTCGSVARCERCDAAVGEGGEGLGCERCGRTRPRICTVCHGTVLRAHRLGVSRVRDALAGIFPSVEIAEVDATRHEVPTAPLVVGTEAALHRVRGPVGLVAFLEFDQELLAARYRAAEQAMWLLVRASRLVGGRRGRVLVQTRVPDHEILLAARDGDPLRVTAAERGRRELLGFPPFGGLAELSGNQDAVATAATALRAAGLEVLGPDVARALIRAPSSAALADALAGTDLEPARARGRLRVEVDPLRV